MQGQSRDFGLSSSCDPDNLSRGYVEPGGGFHTGAASSLSGCYLSKTRCTVISFQRRTPVFNWLLLMSIHERGEGVLALADYSGTGLAAGGESHRPNARFSHGTFYLYIVLGSVGS